MAASTSAVTCGSWSGSTCRNRPRITGDDSWRYCQYSSGGPCQTQGTTLVSSTTCCSSPSRRTVDRLPGWAKRNGWGEPAGGGDVCTYLRKVPITADCQGFCSGAPCKVPRATK